MALRIGAQATLSSQVGIKKAVRLFRLKKKKHFFGGWGGGWMGESKNFGGIAGSLYGSKI